VKLQQLRDIDVSDTIAVGHAKRLALMQIPRNPPDTPARLRLLPGIHQGHAPVFGIPLVRNQLVIPQVERHI
jgi:hypothetical protein